MNEDLNKKYLKKIENINKEFNTFLDKEVYHIEMDEILMTLLKELGYEEIVKKYQNAKNNK